MNNNYYREIPNNSLYFSNQTPYNMSSVHYQNKDNTNLFNLNKGKKVYIYSSFKNSDEWKSKIFNGILEESSKEYLVLSDPKCGDFYIIPVKYIDYIKSEENININPNYYQTSN